MKQQVRRLMCYQLRDFVASVQFTHCYVSEIPAMNFFSDNPDLFGLIKMPPWLQTRSTGALDAGTDNAWTWTRI